VLVSPRKEEATLDRYVDHIAYVADLIGIDHVGIGFDFFEFIYAQWPESKKKWLAEKLTTPHFIPDLTNHSHGRNLTRKLVERGSSVPLNIAEGNGKFAIRDRCRYLDFARGSALECAACLDVLVAKQLTDTGAIAEGKQQLFEIVSMLMGLIKSLTSRIGEDP